MADLHEGLRSSANDAVLYDLLEILVRKGVLGTDEIATLRKSADVSGHGDVAKVLAQNTEARFDWLGELAGSISAAP